VQQGGFGRSLLTGVLIGLLLVAAVVGYLLWTGLQESKHAGPDDVVVMLVLPDEEGVVLPRTVDRYVTSGTGATVEHIDVRKEIAIPGTSYTQLRDAYAFQGPSGVAAAVGADAERTPSYVVLDTNAYARLMGDEPITIDIPEHMEVFDGDTLRTFEVGEAQVAPEDIVALFLGLQYLDAEQRDDVRAQVGLAIAARLAADPSTVPWLETDLSAEEYAAFVTSVGKVVAE